MLDKRARVRAANRAAPWIFAVAAAVMPITTSAQSPLPGEAESMVSGEASPAKRAMAPAPKQVELSAVPQITAKELAAAAARPQLPRPRTRHTEQQYAAFKAQAAQQRFEIPNLKPTPLPAIPSAGSIPASAGSEGVLTPSATISFPGNTQTLCAFVPALGHNATPADMALAVGDTTNGVLQVNNVCISVFSKAGAHVLGPVSLTSFVGLPSTACVFDPRALYDWVNHRYIIAFIQFDCLNLAFSSYWVAVSAADDPTGTYHIYNFGSKFGTTNVAIDFPRLGQDRQAIYVASNVFTTDGMGHVTGYDGEEWLLLPKSLMYAGTTGFVFNEILNPFGAFLDSSQPANVWNPTDRPRAEFFVASLNAQNGFYFDCLFTTGCNGLMVWAVSNPLDTTGPGPELSAFSVPTKFNYGFPPSAAQGTADTIDTGDVRITGEVSYGAGSLHAALTTSAPGGVAGLIQYKIQPVLNDGNNVKCTGAFTNDCADIAGATISDEAVFFYGAAYSAYYPTPQPDPEGNVTTVFNFSGTSAGGPTFGGNTVYISKRVTQAPGTFHDGGFCLTCDVEFFYHQFRWGDYTGVAPAGIAGSTPSPSMWFAGMYVDSFGNWATKIGNNRFTMPNQP